MVDASVLLGALGELADAVAGPCDPDRVAGRATGPLCRLLDADAAAICLTEPGGLRFVAATRPDAGRLGLAQLTAGQGPAHDALRYRRRVTCEDLQDERRWPALVPAARDAGVRALASVPLVAAGQPVGVVTVQAARPRRWRPADLLAATTVADVVAGVLVAARRSAAGERLAAQLQHALEHRLVVEQAKGMLAERHGTTPDAAYADLRGHARAHQAKVTAVARAVVDGRLRL